MEDDRTCEGCKYIDLKAQDLPYVKCNRNDWIQREIKDKYSPA